MKNPSVLKIGQAAKALGVSIDTLRRWEKAGKITAIRTPGGTRLYHVSALKEVNPSSVEHFQTSSLSTEELLRKNSEQSLHSSVILNASEGSQDFESTDSSPAEWRTQNDNLKRSFITKFLIGSAVLSIITLLLTTWITASYLTNPSQTQQFFKNNVAQGLLSPFNKLAEEAVMVISPAKAKLLGFVPTEEPPPLTTNYQLPTTTPNVLAVTAGLKFLEVNADTQINGSLSVRDAINGLTLEATPSASTIGLTSGNTTLTITKTAKLDQDVSTTSTPTFNTLNLSATKNQLVFQSGGPTGTLTWTPTAARTLTLPDATDTLVGKATTDTLTNKSMSGSSNTFTSIPNSALSNSKVTVTAGTNMSGGGDVSLGSSVTLSLASSPAISGVLKLADGTATAPALTFTDDTNTGMYRIGADKIGLITAGTATSGITIDSSGQVGIGTISPTTTLYVSGTGTITGNTTIGGTLAANGGTISTSASSLGFTDGTNTLFSIIDKGSYGFIRLSDKGATGDPSTCSAGDVYFNGTDGVFKACTTTDSWSNLTAGSSGITGYWNRSGTTLSPATAGDAVTTSGNISTSGSGTITSAANITAGGDLAVNGSTSADITSTTDTATVFNSTVTTLSLGGAATTLNLGITDAVTRTINIGTGTGADTIHIGEGGTNANTITIGSDAVANTVTIGSSSATGVSITDNNWGVTTGGAGSFVTLSATPGTDTTALTLTGTNVATSNLAYFNAKNTSGTILNLAYGASATLTGDLIGQAIDLNNGQLDNSNYSVTGLKVTLPTVTDSNATGTTYIRGFQFGFGTGSGINQTGAGATIYSGVDVNLPALTQTAGTLTANGVTVTTSSSITTGGTANGINISASGVGAGTLNGINIGTITGSGGTEVAMAVGTGWDSTLKVGSTTVLNGSGVAQVAAGGTNLTSYTAGDLIYASATTTLAQLAGGVANNGKVLVVSGGLPSWGVMAGSSCSDCVVNDPTSSTTQTIAPTGQSTSALILRQTSTASPNSDIFAVTNSAGTTKYFYVDQNGTVSTGGTNSETLTLTPTTDTTALTLVGTNVATSKLAYFNSKNLSGTIFDVSYGAAATLTGNLIGYNIDLSANVTATGYSVTGEKITLPVATNTHTSGEKTYKGLVIAPTAGGGFNQNGVGGTTTFTGADITMPALTQTAGTLNANGVLVTTPSSITTGGTANGINISASGVAVGTVNGVNISNITAGAGTETALNIGTNWDTGIAIGANASTGTTNTGVSIGNISGATTTNYGINIGTLTGGTGSSVYGINSGTLTSVASGTNFQANLGAVTGATSATFGGIQTGAVSGVGTTSYGINLGANTSTATTNYGINIGAISGAGTNNYGLYVGAVTGAGTGNFAAVFGTTARVYGSPAGGTMMDFYGTNGTTIVGNIGNVGTTDSINLSASATNGRLYLAGGSGGSIRLGTDTRVNQVPFSVYNTDPDSTTVAERLQLDFSSNLARIMTNQGASGTARALMIGTGGTEALRIDTSQNIGIGTTAPDARLEINHATGDSLRLTYNDSDGTATNYTDFSLGATGGLTITGSAATLAASATAEKTFLTLTPGTVTLTAPTQVTSLMETAVLTGATLAGDAAITVNKATALSLVAPIDSTNVTLTDSSGLRILNTTSGAGTLTNQYGLYIEDMTAGATADYGIAIEGADTAALWLSSAADTTDAANGITFGLSKDTNLYRSAANTLKTDDAFIAAGGINSTTIGASTASTGAFTTLSATPGSDATALTLTGTNVSSANLAYFNSKNTSGTIFNIAYGAAATLAGTLTGQVIDLSTNVTNAAQSVTGASLTLPITTAASTTTLKGISLSGGAFTTAAAATTSTWTGLDLTMPNITQGAGSTLTSTGIKITGGTVTSGKSYALITDTNAGYVGIGQSAPAAALHVGAFTYNVTDAAEAGYMVIGNTTQNSGIVMGQGSVNNGFLEWRYNETAASAYYSIDTYAGTNPIVLGDSGSNVGIDDRTPDARLDIQDTGAANNGIIIEQTNAGDYDPYLAFQLADGTNNFILGVDDSDNDTFKIGTTALETSTLFTLDSRATTSGVSAITLSGIASTIASATGAEYTSFTVTPPTITLTGTTQVTSLMETAVLTGATLAGNAAITVDKATTLSLTAPIDSTNVTLTDSSGLRILNTTSGAGTLTNQYGLYIEDMTGGTNDYGIAIEGADTAALWLSSAADNTDAANGITFGLSKDTNLYRSAANKLKTDDYFVLADGKSIGGGSDADANALLFNGSTALLKATTVYLGSHPANYTLTSDSRTTTSGVSAITVSGLAPTIASATGAEYTSFTVTPPTITLTGTTQVTSSMDSVLINAPTITDASAITVDSAATMRIDGPPVAAGSVTLTAPYSLWVDAGTTRLDGSVEIGAPTTANTTALCWDNSGNSLIYDCDGSATDLAENFGTTDASIEAGDVVIMDPAKGAEMIERTDAAGNQTKTSKAWIVKSGQPYQSSLIGVISTSPNQLYGDDGVFQESENPRPVSLAGRVPVKVNTENGPIEAGDYLTSSSTPGVAMKATKAGVVIGKALGGFNEDTVGKILVFISPGFADPNNFLASLTLDNAGNLIMPNIKVDKLTITSEIKVDGKLLTKDNPSSALDGVTSSALDHQIASSAYTDLTQQVASASAEIASASAQIASAKSDLAKAQSDINDLKLTPPDILLATGSATLANLKVTSEATVSGMLLAYQAEIQDNFKVLGSSTLGNTLIAGDLTIDGTLSLTGNSLSTLGTLYIQNGLLADTVDFFNGKLTIDKNGNITTQGEVAASSVKTNKLTISNTPIATTSGVSSGSPEVGAASIGTATLPANTASVTIQTTGITDSAKVFITSVTATDKVLSVTNVQPGVSFDVSVLSPATSDIKFNWWIVSTE